MPTHAHAYSLRATPVTETNAQPQRATYSFLHCRGQLAMLGEVPLREYQPRAESLLCLLSWIGSVSQHGTVSQPTECAIGQPLGARQLRHVGVAQARKGPGIHGLKNATGEKDLEFAPTLAVLQIRTHVSPDSIQPFTNSIRSLLFLDLHL